MAEMTKINFYLFYFIYYLIIIIYPKRRREKNDEIKFYSFNFYSLFCQVKNDAN